MSIHPSNKPANQVSSGELRRPFLCLIRSEGNPSCDTLWPMSVNSNSQARRKGADVSSSCFPRKDRSHILRPLTPHIFSHRIYGVCAWRCLTAKL